MVERKQDTADFLDDFVVTIKKTQNNEERPLLPELTWLPARIKQIKKKQLPRSQSVRAHFTFVISSGKYKDQYAWGSVPLHEEVTEKADLYKWICNILGQGELDVNENVRIGDLVGRSVDIMVKNTKANNGKIYQNVIEIRVSEVTEETEEEEEETPKPAVKTTTKTPVKKVEKPTATKKTAVKEPIEVEEPEGAELDVEEPTEEISEDDLPF